MVFFLRRYGIYLLVSQLCEIYWYLYIWFHEFFWPLNANTYVSSKFRVENTFSISNEYVFHNFHCSDDDTPSVSDVCDNFGMNDVELDYTEADYQNLTTFKIFQQTYQSRIQGANPESPKPRLMMLLAAKWREFQAKNLNM